MECAVRLYKKGLRSEKKSSVHKSCKNLRWKCEFLPNEITRALAPVTVTFADDKLYIFFLQNLKQYHIYETVMECVVRLYKTPPKIGKNNKWMLSAQKLQNLRWKCEFLPNEITNALAPATVTFRALRPLVPSSLCWASDKSKSDERIIEVESLTIFEHWTNKSHNVFKQMKFYIVFNLQLFSLRSPARSVWGIARCERKIKHVFPYKVYATSTRLPIHPCHKYFSIWRNVTNPHEESFTSQVWILTNLRR